MTAGSRSAQADIGVVGLAVMGSNLARNLARHGHAVALYNRTQSRTDELVTEHGSEGTFVPLERIRRAYSDGELPTLLAAPDIAHELNQAQDGWRRTVVLATTLGVPVAGFAGALSYVDTLRRDRLPAAVIQGLRDFFGAHTYRRVDRPGVFHTAGSEDRTEREA